MRIRPADVRAQPGTTVRVSGRRSSPVTLGGWRGACSEMDRVTSFAFLGGVRLPGDGIPSPIVHRAGKPIANGVLDRLATRVQHH